MSTMTKPSNMYVPDMPHHHAHWMSQPSSVTILLPLLSLQVYPGCSPSAATCQTAAPEPEDAPETAQLEAQAAQDQAKATMQSDMPHAEL